MAFYNISRDEMHSFLTKQGFSPMTLPNTRELVYGKIVTVAKFKLSLRVYTAINPDGRSRVKGSDAIRVQLYWREKEGDQPLPCGKSQKCLRVPSWKKNLQAAINNHASEANFSICKKCGAPSVLRKNDDTGDEFWGCSTWIKTKCNGKPNVSLGQVFADMSGVPHTNLSTGEVFNPKKPPKPARTFQIPADKISPRQKAVETYYVDETGNILMGARAGSGKTTMLKHLTAFRKQGSKVVYLAFGRKNAAEGRKKLPREVPSLSTHSFCSQWLRQEYDLPEKQDRGKTWRIMDDVYPTMESKVRRRIRKAAFRLIGLGKNFAIMPGDTAGLKDVMDRYTFELESDKEFSTAIEISAEIMEKSMPGPSGLIYNYDDLLWWPIVLNMTPPKFDDVLADECQDFNACQIELIRRMEANGSRLIVVGDPFQAVFRFRGADSDAYDKIKAMLEGSKRGCKELILPTNYRCAKSILEYVRQNTIVKDIEAAPDAIEGKVIEGVSYLDILDMLVAEHRAAA